MIVRRPSLLASAAFVAGLVLAFALAFVPGMPQAGAAGAPNGGAVRFFVSPSGGGNGGTVVVTGAIGGRGTISGLSTKSATVSLDQGVDAGSTFKVDLAQLRTRVKKSKFPIDTAACTSTGTIVAPAKLTHGTGRLKGLSGQINIIETEVWTMPRKGTSSKAKCDGSKASLFVTATGTGSIVLPK